MPSRAAPVSHAWPRPPAPGRSLLAVALLLLASGGSAAARQAAYFGDAAAMTGGSGMALYRGGGAAWYNPAGLVGNRRGQVDLSASVFVLRVRSSSGLLETLAPGQVHRADLAHVSLDTIPSALVYKRRLSDRVHAAVAVLVTDQSSFQMRDVFEITEPGGGILSRYYQDTTISSKRETYHVGGVISWAVTPRFRLGWGLFCVYSRFAYRFRDLTASHVEDQGTQELQDPWMYAFDVSADSTFWALRLTMGMQWELARGFFVGLTMRSPTIKLHDRNRVDVLFSMVDSGAPAGELAGFFKKLESRDAVLGFTTPMELVLGLAYRGRRFFVGLEGELLLPFYHVLQYVGDTPPQWNLRLGGRVFLTKKVALGLGIFTERSFDKELLYVGDQRLDFYGVTLGLKLRKAYSVRGNKRADAMVFTTTLAVRYGYGVGTTMGYVNDLVGDTSGEVERSYNVHEVSLYLGSSLYF